MKTLSEARSALGNSRPAMNILRVASNVADGETITIGGEVYEVDTAGGAGAITAGRFRVDCSDAVTPAEFTTEFVASVNRNTSLKIYAEKISDNAVLIKTANGETAMAHACAETLAGANNGWAATGMYGGADATIRAISIQSRTPKAVEVALGFMIFEFDFTPASVVVDVRLNNITKAWGGTTTKVGNRVTLTNNGTVDLTTSDTVNVIAGQ